MYIIWLQNSRASILHLETRRPKTKSTHLEFFVTIEGTRDDIVNAVKTLKQSSAVQDVKILSETDVESTGKKLKYLS